MAAQRIGIIMFLLDAIIVNKRVDTNVTTAEDTGRGEVPEGDDRAVAAITDRPTPWVRSPAGGGQANGE